MHFNFRTLTNLVISALQVDGVVKAESLKRLVEIKYVLWWFNFFRVNRQFPAFFMSEKEYMYKLQGPSPKTKRSVHKRLLN